jgi:hypothetical protein
VTAKRSSGQCLGAATRCVPDVGGDAWHGPGCPLYPPQCTCGEPDALTKLERLVRVRRGMSADTFEHEALALIAQAREERKALKADNAAIINAPHPGAALLAEHEKARQSIEDILGAARGYSDKPHQLYSAIRRAAILHADLTQLDQTVAEMDLAYDHHDRHRAEIAELRKYAATAHSRVFIASETQSAHAKALRRARNEGLERAACEVDDDGETTGTRLRQILAERIRAMKEPEE